MFHRGAAAYHVVGRDMDVLDVLGAIYAEFLFPEAIPYAVAALALTAFAWFWRKSLRSPKQHSAVQIALSLWLLVLIASLVGAVFRFTGPDEHRGVAFNELAAFSVQALLVLCAALALALCIYARGSRLNIVAALAPILFVQFWVGLLSGCAIVGVCM